MVTHSPGVSMSFAAHLGATKLVAIGAVATIVVVGAAALTSQDSDVVVTHIVDGDTIDVTIDGQDRRVRLLNVDTPESVDPSMPPQCLGAEATEFLADLIPPGTTVSLEYDREHRDRYGRDLAGVYVDDTLVNAEVARAGFGVAVLIEPNDRFYDDVLAAQEAAEADKIGLFDPAVGCTIAAQTGEFTALAEATLTDQPATTEMASLVQYGEDLAAALAAGVALSEILDGESSTFPIVPVAATIDDIRADVRETRDQLEERITDNAAAINAEQDRIDAEREAIEEADRQAAEEEAERQAAEEAQSQATHAGSDEPGPPPDSSGDSAPESTPEPEPKTEHGGGGLPSDAGYTGCRDYSLQYPASAVDSKGQPFTKIDCTTKLPIG